MKGTIGINIMNLNKPIYDTFVHNEHERLMIKPAVNWMDKPRRRVEES